MNYPQYEKYIDSGVNWLGEIPVGWSISRAKNLFSLAKRPAGENAGIVTAFRDGQVTLRTNRRVEGFTNAIKEIGYQGVRRGDLVIHAMDAFAGAVGMSDSDGKCSPVYSCCIPHTGIACQYYARLLRTMALTGFIESLAKGIRERSTDFRWGDFSVQELPVPPENEQVQICEFLDKECQRIDILISEQEKLITLLKEKRQAVISHAVTKGLNPDAPMKDSGVEWLGMVPAHWNVTRLKHLATVQTGVAKGKDYGSLAVVSTPYLRVANVQDGYFDLSDITQIEIPECDIPRYLLQKGDVLMNEGGDFDKLGRGAIWTGEIANCIHQNHVFAVRPHSICSEWLNAYTSSISAQNYFISRSKQSTNLASISSTNLMELPVPLPPDDEQQATLKKVDAVLREIDALLSESNKASKLLAERRTALISAAVTGKINVQGFAKPVAIQQVAAKSLDYFRRTVFAAEIVDQLCDKPEFGHVMFQKCLYVAQYHLRIDGFAENYYRQAAGPYDGTLIRSVEGQMEKGRWFRANRHGERYSYERLEKCGKRKQYFDSYFGTVADELNRILDLFHRMNTDQAEIVAILYAVWNDFLIKNEVFDDAKIINEVLTNWDDTKKRFPKDQWQRALHWMRDNGLVPTGFGKATKIRDKKRTS